MAKSKDLWEKLGEQPFDFGERVKCPEGLGTVTAMAQTVQGWIVRVELNNGERDSWTGSAAGVRSAPTDRIADRPSAARGSGSGRSGAGLVTD